MPRVSRYPLIALVAAVLAGSTPAAPDDANRDEIARFIKQLGDDNYDRREEASRRLAELGERAEAAVKRAAESPDAEVARRARDIGDRFKWGIYPDTPKKVVDLITRYQGSDRGSSGAIIKELFDCGPDGCKAVLKIVQAEEDPGIRRRVIAQVSNEMPRAVPQILLQNKLDTLDLLVTTMVEQDPDVRTSVGNFTAFCILRGKLDERIARYRARAAKKADDTRLWEVLAYLYRAKGDRAAARAAAEKSARPELVDALLEDAGNWKELCGHTPGGETTLECERLGRQAAYCRLANDGSGFERAIAGLLKLVADSKDDEATALLVAKSLFLNGRVADGLDTLVRHGDRAMAFEIFVTRMQFREALQLAEAERKANGRQLPDLEILEARTRWSLGDKEKAAPVFARYGDLISGANEQYWVDSLVESEVRVGLTDQALKHAAKAIALSQATGVDRRLMQKLFPNKTDAANVWWDFLRRRQPDRDGADVLKQVGAILRGSLPPADVKKLIAEATAELKKPGFGADDPKAVPGPGEPPGKARPRNEITEEWVMALAEAALEIGDKALAEATLANSATSGPLQKLGDLFAEKKLWDRAADCYRRAWEADRTKPLPMFLWGHALTKSGHEQDGSRRMNQARWLPLGNEESRLDFVVALGQRGFKDASHEENDILLRSSEPASYRAGEAKRRIALEARARKDFLGSAAGQEQSTLRCFRAYVTFVQPSAYVAVPAMIHRHRTRGWLAAGKLDDALREANQSLDVLPADVDVPVLLVPELEKAGRKKDADALVARVRDPLEAIAKQFPKCGWVHNSLAWLSACCRRDLDGGLGHVRTAIELEPNSAGLRDTLAEVCLQLGRKDEAIAAEKKAVELDPKKAYYRKQLQRMQAGDPNATRPSEEDDEDEE